MIKRNSEMNEEALKWMLKKEQDDINKSITESSTSTATATP
jgi:hypothetical protein